MSGSLDKQRKAFKANPSNTRAFEALEEHYFLEAKWQRLVEIYEHRLRMDSLKADPSQAAPLLFRLAQIVEERLEDEGQAHEHYKHCARLAPKFRPALQALRRIHSARGQWDLVLQIAEVENKSNFRADERAGFLAEIGAVWLDHLDEATEALSHFQEALGFDPGHSGAQVGLARTLGRLGRHPAAAEAWERAIASTQGIERAKSLAALAQLFAGPLQNRQRAIECYRRAFADDPRNEEAVCALVIDATAREQWSELPDLYDRRFDTAVGASRRATVALEAGHMYLERLQDLDAARRWFERAQEFCPDDMAVHQSLAEVARRSDDTTGLARALDRLIALAGDQAPASALLEAADICGSSGESERAFELLTRARERSPDNSLVLDALSDALAETGRVGELCEVLETRAGLAAYDDELQAEIYCELGRRQESDLADAEAARRAYQSAFDAYPQSPEAAAKLLELLNKAEAWDDLEHLLERARADGPPAERADFHCALGEFRLNRQNDYSGAAEAFDAALALTAELSRALQGLLQAAIASGDEDAQIDAYEREARATADSERRRVAVAQLVRLLEARGRIKQAIEWLETLHEPGCAARDTLETIARLASLPDPDAPSDASLDSEQLIGVLERLDEAIVRDEPEAFDAPAANRQRLAALHAEAGDSEQAILWYEACLRAAPDNTQALSALRNYYPPETHPDDRIRINQALLEVVPEGEREELLADLASLLEERSGDFDGAIQALQALLRLSASRERDDSDHSDDSDDSDRCDEADRSPHSTGADSPGESLNQPKLLPRSRHEDRLEKLLERTGRFEDLVVQLADRGSRQQDANHARAIDLRRAGLLLDRLERAPEAAQLYRAIFAQHSDCAEAAEGLERATRMEGDPAALACLLAEISQAERDPVRRSELEFERASLFDGPLDDPDAALAGFRSVLNASADTPMAEAAGRRAESLLEKMGDFAGLRALLEARLLEFQDTRQSNPDADPDLTPDLTSDSEPDPEPDASSNSNSRADEIRTLRERLAALCRDKLSDTSGCISHLEALAAAAPLETRAWQELATLYDELDRPQDRLRVTSAQLACDLPRSEELAVRACALRLSLELESSDDDHHAVENAERLLELDPSHAEAAQLLSAYYEREDRPADIARVLHSRLSALLQSDVAADAIPKSSTELAAEALARTALRLRIARILSAELQDEAGAIDVLEPALTEAAGIAPAAEPLAALYESTGRSEALADLCRLCADQANDNASRIRWQLRLANALRSDLSTDGDLRAVRVYEEVLETQPQEVEARTGLRQLYRKRGDHAPLARLLERELGLAPEHEVQTLEELAPLLESGLQQPEAALPLWLRMLEFEPMREAAFLHALSLSRDLGEHDTQRLVIEQRLQLDVPGERALLLELRGDVLAGALDRPREAIADYRQALDVCSDPSSVTAKSDDAAVSRVRRSLRDVLERLALWPAFLECVEHELAQPGATSDERSAVLERAAEVAYEHVGPDAALPWLERLRKERPSDRDVIARIASVHRQASRRHALLDALGSDLQLLGLTDTARRRELRLERANIFQHQLDSPSAAVQELESLRKETAGTPELLGALDGLYDELGRDRERCEVLEALLAESDDALRRVETARLYSQSLDDPNRAIVHWLHALSLVDAAAPPSEGHETPLSSSSRPLQVQRVEWLTELAADLERTHRWDAWTRAVEARLAASDSENPEAAFSDLERASLQVKLAGIYSQQLGRSQSAARHWRAVLEWAESADAGVGEELLECAERALIGQLRDEGGFLELEDRLRVRLARVEGAADEWLELGQLRLETLSAPTGAIAAFDEALDRAPNSRAALGGLRRAAESIGDWERVAQALAWELKRVASLAPEHRVGMGRRLGEMRWHKLNQRDEAGQAFAEALEAVPGDLQTLTAYAQLCEESGDWPKAVALLEEQVQSLASGDPARRKDLWLRIARLSRDRCADPQHATHAYGKAAQLGALRASDQRRWAELHREAGEAELFVDVFSGWCDDRTAAVQCSDLLTLAIELEKLARPEEALERVHQAQLLSEDEPAAWDMAARLEREAGNVDRAIDCLERAAELRSGTGATERLTQAALLAEAPNPERACGLLRRAAEADSGGAHVFAHLAVVEERLGHLAEAEQAAARALDLDDALDRPLDSAGLAGLADAMNSAALAQPSDASPETNTPLPTELRLACALAGGNTARQDSRPESADRFFAAVLELEPQHAEALAAHGELLFERGDTQAAKGPLEQRLELGEDPDRASHLAMVGTALLRGDDPETAGQRFAEALADDPALGEAHSGLVQIHEEAGRIDQAVEALSLWASQLTDAKQRCQQLLRAAELEVARNQPDTARKLLRQATEVFPASERAWLALSELATSGGGGERWEDALVVSSEALTHVTEGPERARLTFVHAAALEADGQREEAVTALAEGLALEPLCVDAALNRGRLQRDLGHWADAAAGFQDFLTALPDAANGESPVPGAALVYRELGRLMAGPLEDIEEAIRCYERAVALEPELSNVRDPLASLLTHFPKRRADALFHHRQLLLEDPARQTSLRCLLRIARDLELKDAEETGLAVLRALAAAGPGGASQRAPEPASRRDALREENDEHARLPKRVVLHERLEDDHAEKARRLLLDAAEELQPTPWDDGSDSMVDPRSRSHRTQAPAQDAFGQSVAAVLRRLIGEAFADYSSAEIASTVGALVEVATGKAKTKEASPLARELDDKLSRRAHKRLRRTLHGGAGDRVQSIDFDAWHSELRALATAVALDESEGDLRGALLSLLRASTSRCGEELDLCEEGELFARIAGEPEARALLQRVVLGWASELADRA